MSGSAERATGANAPRIRVTADGPYQVSGPTPLMRTSSIETEHHEPVAWSAPEPLPTGRRYALCRCGRSRTKPFCDDSHLEEPPFEGPEVADRGPRADRARTLVGDNVVMTDDRSICSHAGFCANRATSVWEMIRRTDDPEIRERLRQMIDRCPSGALDHAASETDAPDEPTFEPSIAVTRDGPLWVRGGVTIESTDGTAYEVRNRVTLCRCGHSSNKPFCDGSHDDVGFRDG